MMALFIMATANAKDYYCMPGGSGDGTTYDTAGEFTTLVKNLKAGDVLYCRGGQYNFSSNIKINVSGTSSAKVCIFACDGEQPIFDFRMEEYGSRGVSNSGNYLHMRGITIRYSGKNGLYNEGSYCVFENMDVYGNGDSGVQMKNGHSNLILNVDSHDNFDYKLSGITAADFGGNADGFADKQYTGGGNTYRGCRAWNNSDDGWDFYQHVTGSYGPTIIENCVCYANGPGEYNMIGHGRYEKDKSWFDQFAGAGIDVTDNDGNYPCRVSLEHYTNWGNANGFKLGGGKTNHNVIVRQSISVMNGNTCTQGESKGAKGIDQNNNAGEMWIYSNTAYNNSRNIGFNQNACGTAHFMNNISYKGEISDLIDCARYDEKNNDWNISGISVKDADFRSLDHTQLLAPRQADGSLPVNDFMRLTDGSQLIDRGTADTELPFYGEAPDLGCYEYESGQQHGPVTMTVEGELTQILKAGKAMTPVNITAGGSAEGIALQEDVNIPGVTISIEGMTASVSGTPTTPGTYTATFVPVVDITTTQSVTLKLIINDPTAITVGYITTGGGNNEADRKIVEALTGDFSVNFFDADRADNNYTECDALVISPLPSSKAAAMAGLKNYNLPTLLLKPWMMKSGVWSWGTAQNTSDLAVTVTDASHEIFNDIALGTDNKLTLFTQKGGDAAVTAISATESWSGYVTLATPVSNSSISIADLTGATLSGAKINNRYIMIGVSEYSTAYLTADAQRLINNACHYILNLQPSAIHNVKVASDATPYYIYTLEGRRVNNPGKGVYIVNGKKVIF